MKEFAAGLKKNLTALRAGLRERWSNGPVEGFVTKLIKATGPREGDHVEL
jgi:transposase